jgi:hypothetical protein
MAVAEEGGRQVVVQRVDGRPRILPEMLSQAAWRIADVVRLGVQKSEPPPPPAVPGV